jgi:hypothetical protein
VSLPVESVEAAIVCIEAEEVWIDEVVTEPAVRRGLRLSRGDYVTVPVGSDNSIEIAGWYSPTAPREPSRILDYEDQLAIAVAAFPQSPSTFNCR